MWPPKAFESPKAFEWCPKAFESPKAFEWLPKAFESPKTFEWLPKALESPKAYYLQLLLLLLLLLSSQEMVSLSLSLMCMRICIEIGTRWPPRTRRWEWGTVAAVRRLGATDPPGLVPLVPARQERLVVANRPPDIVLAEFQCLPVLPQHPLQEDVLPPRTSRWAPTQCSNVKQHRSSRSSTCTTSEAASKQRHSYSNGK